MTDADNQEDLPVIDTEIDKLPSFIDTYSEFGGEESKREQLETHDARRYKTEVPAIEDYDRRAKSFETTSELGNLERFETQSIKQQKSEFTISKSKNWFDQDNFGGASNMPSID